MSRRVKREKPYIIVFCEGESEQAYADFLKREFRDVAVIQRPKSTGTFGEADRRSVTTPNTSIMLRLRMRSGSSLMWKPLTFGSGAAGCG